MTDRMDEAWLDGAPDACDVERMEHWLREDDAHVRDLVQSAVLQESLRAAYRAETSRTSPNVVKRRWQLSTTAVAAALAMAFGLSFNDIRDPIRPEDEANPIDPFGRQVAETRDKPDTPQENPSPWREPEPDAPEINVPKAKPEKPVIEQITPELKVIKGDLEVMTKGADPGRIATVRSKEDRGVLEWGAHTVEFAKGTEAEFLTQARMKPSYFWTEKGIQRVIRYVGGQIRIRNKLQPKEPRPIVLQWKNTTIVAHTADFSFEVTPMRKQPVARDLGHLTVFKGSVKVYTAKGTQTVDHGQSYDIEIDR